MAPYNLPPQITQYFVLHENKITPMHSEPSYSIPLGNVVLSIPYEKYWKRKSYKSDISDSKWALFSWYLKTSIALFPSSLNNVRRERVSKGQHSFAMSFNFKKRIKIPFVSHTNKLITRFKIEAQCKTTLILRNQPSKIVGSLCKVQSSKAMVNA